MFTGQIIELKLKSFDHKLLDNAIKSIISVVRRTDAAFQGPIPLPSRRERFTVNRSTHVNKKSREQLEIQTHKRLLRVNPGPKTVDELMGHELPSGVEVKIKLKGE